MNWFIVALTAYFLLAIANLIDKFLVEKVLGSARAYTFVTATMGLLVFVIAPWFISWPGWSMFLFNIILGGVFSLALLFLYAALRRGDASQVLVLIGGSTPIFSAPLAFWLLGDVLSSQQLLAILFLIFGLLIIAFLPKQKKSFWGKMFSKLLVSNRSPKLGVLLAILSGLSYAIFFVGSKLAYQEQDFLSAFLWTRLGAAMFSLIILFSKRARQEISALFKKKPSKNKNQLLLFFNQGIGAGGFILQNYAIYLGPVAIVNALQGLQYAWIIILGTLISIFAPKILKEDISKSVLIKKTIAIIIISIGLYFLIV